jgi:hypothetical protein
VALAAAAPAGTAMPADTAAQAEATLVDTA